MTAYVVMAKVDGRRFDAEVEIAGPPTTAAIYAATAELRAQRSRLRRMHSMYRARRRR